MILLPLLCLLGAALGEGPHPSIVHPHGGGYVPKGPSLDEVKAAIDDLEQGLLGLQQGITADQTLSSIGEDRLKRITEKNIPALNLKNEQQDALINLFKGQIKDLQHRADDALAATAAAKSRGLDTGDVLQSFYNTLVEVNRTNSNQSEEITRLSDKIASHKEYIIGRINGSRDYLESRLYEVKNKVYLLHEHVDRRKCEYGCFSVGVDADQGTKRIDFKSRFDAVPHVAVTLTGFAAHLDVVKYGNHEYDILGIDKYVSTDAVDQDGFNAKALDASKGMVDLKRVYCCYMACQYLDHDLVLPPHDGDK